MIIRTSRTRIEDGDLTCGEVMQRELERAKKITIIIEID